MNTNTEWTAFLKAAQAERIAGDCGGCANLARMGAPMQCNRHRASAPDRMTRALALVTEFTAQVHDDPRAAALAAVGA